MSAGVTVIMPTHNRSGTVVKSVLDILKRASVEFLIVVADGCTDDTENQLTAIQDRRLELIVNTESQGPEVARNQGAVRATTEWLAFVDDDDQFPDTFFDTLLQIAEESQADLVAAPWLHIAPGTDPEYAAAAQPRVATISANSCSTFPSQRFTESVWIHCNFIVRSVALQTVRFNEKLRGNYWRDETDFAVQVARLGGLVVVTNATFSYMFHGDRSGGISHANSLRYEMWTIVNEIGFTRRHGRWLTERNFISGPVRFLLRSVCRRIAGLLTGFLRARLQRDD